MLKYLKEATKGWNPYIENSDQDELVIICHGWISGPVKLNFLADFLSKKNYSIFRLNLSTTFGTVSKILNEANSQLESIDFGKSYKKVHFLGHSFGGIILKILLNKDDWKTTDRFVTLGTPWGSTPFAKKVENMIKFKDDPSLFGNGIVLLKQALNNPIKNKNIKVGLIGGDKPYKEKKVDDGIKWDGTVPTESALSLKENVVDKKIMHLNHTELINNKVVGVMVSNFFNRGKF